ncbi:MAG: NADH-quinone oxidoreductase subunit N, partial [Halobacteriales archaeon]|nr:NADH-quinone oxidoreductase subunit N [Halobacteriales archaeon]
FLLGFKVSRGGLALMSAMGILEAAALCLIQLAGIGGPSLPSSGTAFGLLEVNAFVLVFELVFLAVAFLVVLGSPDTVRSKANQGEYYGLLLFATVGMMMVAGSRDLITLFLSFELSSFATYALAGFRKRDPSSVEAAMKYFITGSVSSALILFGISLVYAMTTAGTAGVVPGDLTFQNIGVLAKAGLDPFAPLVIFAVMFLFAGFGFKIAAFPFHMWAPDVYDGSPTAVSAYLAAGSKKMGFAALFKVFLVGLIALANDWVIVAGILAIATMTIGNVLALQQTNIKRLLAYSSIAQAGYIMIAIPVAAVADPAAGQYALAGGIFHIITHAFMKAGAFIAVAGLFTAGLSARIGDYKGLSRRNPLLAFALAVFLISFAGIPPLAGFASKFVLFSGAVNASLSGGQGWLIALAIAGVLNSAVSLYYYAKVIRIMYVEDPEPHQAHAIRVPGAVTASVVIALAFVIVIGLDPGPVLDVSVRAAQSLLAAAPVPLGG